MQVFNRFEHAFRALRIASAHHARQFPSFRPLWNARSNCPTGCAFSSPLRPSATTPPRRAAAVVAQRARSSARRGSSRAIMNTQSISMPQARFARSRPSLIAVEKVVVAQVEVGIQRRIDADFGVAHVLFRQRRPQIVDDARQIIRLFQPTARHPRDLVDAPVVRRR